MAGRVDARALLVRDGATGIPFAVDCGTGTATLDPGGEPHPLRLLSWREKCSLARFADAGPAFIEQQFVAICGGGILPEDPLRRAAATALAVWLHGSPALPLDPALLGEVTIRLCATLGVGPAELATLPAPEVEALWHAVRAEGTEAGAVATPRPPAVDGVTRILIEPDPPARAERLQAEPPPGPERAVPISAEIGPLRSAGTTAAAAAASTRRGFTSPPAAPLAAEAARSQERAQAPLPRGTGPAATATEAGQGPEAAAETTEALFGTAMTLGAVAGAGAASTRPGLTPAPPAPLPAETADRQKLAQAASRPRGSRPAATAAAAGQGVKAAAEATEAVSGSAMPSGATGDDVPQALSSKAGLIDGPAARTDRPSDLPPIPTRRPPATPARNSDRCAATSADAPERDRSSDPDGASGALPSPPNSPARPIARFRLVPAKKAASDVAGPCVDEVRPPAGRPRSESSSQRPPALHSAADATSVRTSANRQPLGRRRAGRRPAEPAAAAAAVEGAEPAGPDDVSAHPADPRARPIALAEPAAAASNPVPPQAPEGPPARHEPVRGGRRRVASGPKSPMPRFAAPGFNRPSFPAPETDAATAIDSRLRALIDIVSRVPEARSDVDRNPEAIIDIFSERLAEAASELGLAGGD